MNEIGFLKSFSDEDRAKRIDDFFAKKYNLQVGDILYLEKKKRKASKDNIVHVLRSGESMYSVSQKYGIRLKNLYKLNKMTPDDPAPALGTILRLR